MGLRLAPMLKDAAITAFVAATLGIFIVGFRTVSVGTSQGLVFEYHFSDLAIAVATVFCGRLGLSLAANGLRWPSMTLGAVLILVGVAPLQMPSDFLHWFVALAGVLLIGRGIWPWATDAVALGAGPSVGRARARDRHQMVRLDAARGGRVAADDCLSPTRRPWISAS